MRGTQLLTTLCLGATLWSADALACGCFTPPDPTVPVLQAGERILFSVENGQVTSHVQLQYSGDAKEFGWLLPLPSVPKLELGTDELFTFLTSTTQPTYRVNYTFDERCSSFGGQGGAGGASASGPGSSGLIDAGVALPSSPLVVEDSIGPYDYAVLKADSRDAMLEWLATNHYFVPVGTTDAVAPYIHEGGYFLALKLRSGRAAGDVQPVVLRYASDVGMIPITLTSTGATQNMGVQVWMLGEGRAIPRNYFHTQLNDAVIDWQRAGFNYNDVVIRAVGEAPGKHSFITEYAGSSSVMTSTLAPAARFGTQPELAAQPTARQFLNYLFSHGFSQGSTGTLPATAKAVLAEYLPVPEGVSADAYYAGYAPNSQNPTGTFAPTQMAQALWERVVLPTQAAQALFTTRPYLTRLYTTISPADMNRDPVFSFNAALPRVSNVHQASMHVSCSAPGVETRATLVTEQGWNIDYPDGRFAPPAVKLSSLPASAVIEALHDEGSPEVLTNNFPQVSEQLPEVKPWSRPPQSCDSTSSTLFALGLLPMLLLVRSARRRA